MIFWHGVSSDDVFLFVEHYPDRPTPKRKRKKQSVPGMSGDLIFEENAWENYLQPYDIYISAERPGKLPAISRKVVEWLMWPGYQILEDEYDPDTFRLAAYDGGEDLENTLNLFGRATISFDCKPQRYLKSGAAALQMVQGGVLVNPSIYTAMPLIVVQGAGAGVLTVGQHTIELNDCNNITLDCETEDAYRGVSNLNTTVSQDFPKLEKGNSAVGWSGGITGVTITPRWYVL